MAVPNVALSLVSDLPGKGKKTRKIFLLFFRLCRGFHIDTRSDIESSLPNKRIWPTKMHHLLPLKSPQWSRKCLFSAVIVPGFGFPSLVFCSSLFFYLPHPQNNSINALFISGKSCIVIALCDVRACAKKGRKIAQSALLTAVR